MLYDKLRASIQLHVSDIRESILKNLSLRFEAAGVKAYKIFVADLTAENKPFANEVFDIILCDVPCSGSGTWARTPEQLFFFNEKSLRNLPNASKKSFPMLYPAWIIMACCFISPAQYLLQKMKI